MIAADTLSNVLDTISFVAALVALVISLLSLRAAQAQRRMAAKEHAEFMRDLRARAELDVRVRGLDGPEDDLLERPPGALRTYGVVEVGIKNTGKRAARDTILNLVAPSWLEELSWAEPDGTARSDARVPVPTPDERLTDGGGQDHSGIYLVEVLPLIGRRPAYVRYARFILPHGHGTVPFCAIAQSDDLPDEVFEVRQDFLLRLRDATGEVTE